MGRTGRGLTWTASSSPPAIVAAAVAVALLVRRRRPDAPPSPRRACRPQVDRADFARPEAPWLVAVFTSATCHTCADVVAKATVLASDDVAVAEVEYGAARDVHRRYRIDSVPIVRRRRRRRRGQAQRPRPRDGDRPVGRRRRRSHRPWTVSSIWVGSSPDSDTIPAQMGRWRNSRPEPVRSRGGGRRRDSSSDSGSRTLPWNAEVSPDSVRPCWIRLATSRPSMVSCSSSASAISSSPRRCLTSSSVGPLLLLGEDAGDLLVEQLGGLVAVLAAAGHQVLAEEHLLLAAPRHRADAVAHAPLADHPAGDRRRLLEVVGGAAVEVAEDDLLGDSATHRLADDVLEVLLRVRVALLRQAPRDAEGHASRQDRHLVQRVAVGQHRGQQGVAALVVGGRPLLLAGHAPGSRAGHPARPGHGRSRSRSARSACCRGGRRTAPPR